MTTDSAKIYKLINERNDSCRKYNASMVYDTRGIDPMLYNKLQDFSNTVPFTPQKHCKLLKDQTKKPVLDESAVYWKDVYTNDECKHLGGFIDKGLCFTKENKPCRVKMTPLCELDSRENVCELARTKFGRHVCIAKQTKSPPKKKGHPISDGEKAADISTFLHTWYKEHNLLSEGHDVWDRCNNTSPPLPSTSTSKTIEDDGPEKFYTIQQMRQFTFPFSASNAKILKSAYGAAGLLEIEHAIQQKAHPERFNMLWSRNPYYKQQIEYVRKSPIVQPTVETKLEMPSLSQSIINLTLKKDKEMRGLMAWHSTGSGKTCTAAGVMEAFWDSGKTIIYASSTDGLSSNPPYKFHECLSKFYPRFKGMSVEQVGAEFSKRGVKYLSFASLASRITKFNKLSKVVHNKSSKSNSKPHHLSKIASDIMQTHPHFDAQLVVAAIRDLKINNQNFIDLDNSVLVMDEVHNLFRPLPHQKKLHKYVETELLNSSHNPQLKVVILTATPGDSPHDILTLLNIVRKPSQPRLVLPNFKSESDVASFATKVKGLVSYFDSSKDTSFFPVVKDTGPVSFPMSMPQFKKYIEAYGEVTEGYKNYEALQDKNQLANFWKGARKYSNMLYNFDSSLQLSEFSSKLPKLIDNITKFQNEKQYVYSAFYENRGTSQGILEIERQLVKKGYKKLSKEDAKNIGKISPAKRYILATSKETSVDTLINAFNNAKNASGELVQVFLATQKFNEGIDLKAVKHIHIFEPLVTMASDLQTIGRARRYCSHSQLPHDEWKVEIHRYMADMPVDFDDYLKNLKKNADGPDKKKP
jgi:hypothetical protein